jgi:hypothetical protein
MVTPHFERTHPPLLQSRTADVTCVLPALGRPVRMAHAAGVNRFAVCSVQSAPSLAHASDPNSRGRWWPVHPPRRLASSLTNCSQSLCLASVGATRHIFFLSAHHHQQQHAAADAATGLPVCDAAVLLPIDLRVSSQPGPVPAVGTARSRYRGNQVKSIHFNFTHNSHNTLSNLPFTCYHHAVDVFRI